MTNFPFVIWYTKDAPEPVRFAASELASYLERMTGQAIGTQMASDGTLTSLELRGGPAERTPIGPTSVVTELARRVRPLPPRLATTPGPDAFLWRTGDAEVTIAGTNPRSVLYGVYDLLEELGFRFFAAHPDDEVVPTLTVDDLVRFLNTAGERFEQATFAYRERHFLEWIDAA